MDDDMTDQVIAAINDLAQQIKAKHPHLINPDGEPTDSEAIEFVEGMVMHMGHRSTEGLTKLQLAGYNYAAKDAGDAPA